jgi:uncharacterized membrane protein YraQ (UPF0718 family)
MSILIFCQVQQTFSVWETIFAIFVAFIGGGIVNFLFEWRKNKKKGEMFRHLIASEVKMNLDILESEQVRNHPWISHKTWSSFYDANLTEVISFSDKEIAEKIMKFYATMEALNLQNEDNSEYERLKRQSTLEAAHEYREALAKRKSNSRNSMIEIGRGIIQNDK